MRKLLLSYVLLIYFGADLGAQPTAKQAPRPNAQSPLGINLATLSPTGTEIPFTDVFPLAGPWVGQSLGKPSGKGDPLELDAKGWVLRLKEGQIAETVLFAEDGRQAPAGDYTCLYEGKGEIEFDRGAKTITSKPGRITLKFTPAQGPIVVRLTKTDPADPIRNIRLVLPGFEKNYQENLFHPEFLERWAKFKVLRFKDWQQTNGSKLVEWAERSTPSHATQTGAAGVCVEHMIDLANALGADSWFCMPHAASDDFVQQFARLVKQKLQPDLKVYLEFSNECWNGHFAQAKYCRDHGAKLKFSDNLLESQLRFYSQRSVEVFELWKKEFSDDSGRLVRVLSAQGMNIWTGTTVLEWRHAYNNADAIAIAPQFGSEFGDPGMVEKIKYWSAGELLNGCRKSIQKNLKFTRLYAEKARAHDLKLLAYDGGQRLAGYRGVEENKELRELFQAANRHPKMREMYLEHLSVWKEAGGDMFCLFTSMSPPSKAGSWGLLEYPGDDIRAAPKYQAALEFIERNR